MRSLTLSYGIGWTVHAASRWGQSELRTAALLKAVWWDFRLASLLTHLF